MSYWRKSGALGTSQRFSWVGECGRAVYIVLSVLFYALTARCMAGIFSVTVIRNNEVYCPR